MHQLYVTGGSGFLGQHVNKRASEREGYSIYSLSWQNCLDSYKTSGLDGVLDYLDSIILPWDSPCRKSVVNLAALTSLELCQRDPVSAITSNAFLPYLLSIYCDLRGIHGVNISTDQVYSDEKTDCSSPSNIYGLTKRIGDLSVDYSTCCNLRTTFVGLDLRPERRGIVEVILSALKRQEPLGFVSDWFFSPVHVDIVADLVISICEKRVVGCFDLFASNSVSKYQFAIELLNAVGVSDPNVLVEEIIYEHFIELRHLAVRPKSLILGNSPLPISVLTKEVEEKTRIDHLYWRIANEFKQR